MLYTWSTDEYPEDLRYEAWTSLISSSAYELSFDKPKEARFRAAHRSFQLNNVGIRNGSTDPFSCERTTREVRKSSDPFYTIQGTLSGEQYIDYLGVNAVLKPGDVYLWDSEHIGKVKMPEKTDVFSLIIPKHILDPDLNQRSGLKVLAANTAIKSLLSTVVETTISNANTFEKNQLQSVEDVVLSLAIAAFSGPKDDPRLSYRAAKLERIKTYIKSNLEDPNLSPINAAATLGMSPRDLHLTFSEDSDTFMSYLQNARIEQAMKDLRQSSSDFQSITQIAYKHGFNSSSQFSQTFKRHNRITPREYRKAYR